MTTPQRISILFAAGGCTHFQLYASMRYVSVAPRLMICLSTQLCVTRKSTGDETRNPLFK